MYMYEQMHVELRPIFWKCTLTSLLVTNRSLHVFAMTYASKRHLPQFPPPCIFSNLLADASGDINITCIPNDDYQSASGMLTSGSEDHQNRRTVPSYCNTARLYRVSRSLQNLIAISQGYYRPWLTLKSSLYGKQWLKLATQSRNQ